MYEFTDCWNRDSMFILSSQTAIKKNNPRKFLRSVGDGEVVEFDVIEATKVRIHLKGNLSQLPNGLF